MYVEEIQRIFSPIFWPAHSITISFGHSSKTEIHLHMFLSILLCIAHCAQESAGIGGFITFGFDYKGSKQKLLTSLSINVKTPPPQNSNVDSTVVQPTGYWIVATPSHHELVVSVKGPEGVIIEPQSQFIQYPFNTNIDFQIVGFSAIGQIVTAQSDGSLIKVLSPLTVEITDGKDITLTTTTSDGSYTIGPLPPGEYVVSLKDAVAEPKKFKIVDQSAKVEELVITDWPQNGVVNFPEGIKPHSVSLVLTSNDNSDFKMDVKTEENGRFSIKGLHVGSYQLKSAVEDIVISSLSFTISAKENPKPLALRYEGIRIHGSVLYPNGQGLGKVNVKLSPGNFQTTTDKEGNFVFPAVHQISQPHLEFSYPYHKFSEAEIPSIGDTPIPHIKVNVLNAQICGTVECPANLTFSGAIKLNLAVTNGTFCISAPISQSVNIKAVSQCGFEHSSLTVTSPIDNIKFARIKASVTGHARCIGDCDTNTVFRLYNDQYSYTASVMSNGNVEFNDVEFGRYHLSISSSPNAIWNVLQNDIFVSSKTVEAEDIGEQAAFSYNVTVSHQMDVKCGDKELSLNRGVNTISVRSTIVEPNSCLLFKPVDLKTSQRIIVESIKRQVIVKGPSEAFNVYLNGVELPPPYEFIQKFNEISKVSIKTKAPYFSIPTEIEAKSVSSCSESPITFEVLVGVEYAGQINPPIDDVSVTAILNDKIIATAQTGDDGKFSLGSFPSNKNITLKAEKKGYKFTQEPNSFNFAAEKLSSILIHFNAPTNVNTKGILLSISRLDGFAHNVITDSSDDVIINGLDSGNYFLMPIFREHLFEPKQVEFNLTQGTQLNLTFSVTRVQFGINGEVRRITGEFEPDVEIEANYGQGEKQVVQTDARGCFRIGGLNPNQTVTLLARASGTSLVERITPAQLKIKMGSEEYRGVRFLSMKPKKSYDILGELVVEPDFLPTMNVVLMTPTSQVVQRFTFPSKLSNMFFFTNLSLSKYNIIVANTRQVSSIVCPKQEVDLNQPVSKIQIVCEVSAQARTDEKDKTNEKIASFIAFFAVLCWLFFFNFVKFSDFINDLISSRKKKRSKRKTN